MRQFRPKLLGLLALFLLGLGFVGLPVPASGDDLPAASVTGECYFHTEQWDFISGFQLVLDQSVSGQVYLQLVDQNDRVIARSQEQSIDNTSYLYFDDLKFLDKPSAGTYTLQVVLNGQALNQVSLNDQSPRLEITDQILVSFASSTYLNGKTAHPGDRIIYLTVWAWGVQDPADIQIALLDEEQNNLVQDCLGEIAGRDSYGRLELLYRLELSEILEDTQYQLQLTGTNSKEVIFPGNHTWKPDSYPSISVTLKDPAAGRISLQVNNLPAGQYNITVQKQKSLMDNEVIDTLDAQTVDYNGSGVIDITLQKDGRPVSLDGYYRLNMGQSGTNFWVAHADNYYFDQSRTEYPTVLQVSPAALLRTGAAQTLAVNALLANINPQGQIKLDLVQMDRSNQQAEKVVATATITNLKKTSDPRDFRFNSLYKLTGTLELSGNPSDEFPLRWRITCQNSAGEERTFFYQPVVKVHLVPRAAKMLLPGALQPVVPEHHFPGGDYPGGQFGEEETWYISPATTALEVVLAELTGLDQQNAAQVTLQLQNSAGQSVASGGNLTYEATAGVLRGTLSLPDNLAAGRYTLVARYQSSSLQGEVARTAVQVLEQPVAGQIAPLADSKILLPTGQSFSISLLQTLNLGTDGWQMQLTPLAGQPGPQITVQAAKQEQDINLYCTADQTLTGWYKLDLLYNNQPINQLPVYDGNPYPLYLPELYFTDQPFVRDAARQTERGVLFSGLNLSAGAAYRAVLYRSDTYPAQSSSLTLERLDDQTLLLSNEQLTGLAGPYRAYIIQEKNDETRVLPVTQNMTILRLAGQKQVVPPRVTINGGARFTSQPEININIEPGTFTLVKVASSEAELAAAPYGPVSSSLAYTLTGDYGTKTIYLRFKDDDGLESSVLTASIEYLASTLPAPAAYGVSPDTFSSGQTIQVWIKAAGKYSASVELAGAAGTIKLYSLQRGSLQEGLYTYSRLITVDDSLRTVQKAIFTLKDSLTGALWQAEQTVTFEEKPVIDSTATRLVRLYPAAGRQYLDRGEPVQLELKGSPGKQAAARVVYQTAGGESTADVPLTEASDLPGTYRAVWTVPDGCTRLEKVQYRLTSASTSQSDQREENCALDVSAGLKFQNLPNDAGDFKQFTLTIYSQDSFWLQRQIIIDENNTTFTLPALPPGQYGWQLANSYRIYNNGQISLSGGTETTVDLTNTPLPARLTIKVTPAGEQPVSGYILYRLNDQTYEQYHYFTGQSPAVLSGLARGEQVKYRLQLNWSSLQYYLADEQEYTVELAGTEQQETINLQPVSYQTITGRIVDEDDGQPVPGATVYIKQYMSNGGFHLYNNRSVTSDVYGNFTLQALPTAGHLLIQKDNYSDRSVELTASGELGSDTQAIQSNDRLYINLQLLVAEPTRPGEEKVYLPAAGQYLYDVQVFDQSGRAIDGWYNYYRQVYQITDQNLSKGQQLTVKARHSLNYQEQLTTTVTLDSHLRGTASFQMERPGYLSAQVINRDDPGIPCHLLIFQNNRRVGLVSGTGTLHSRQLNLASGEYTILLLSGQDLTKINRLISLDSIQRLQLQENVHYLQTRGTISTGTISDLGQFTVPTITNQQLGMLNEEGTSLDVKQKGITDQGKILVDVTVKFNLAEKYRQNYRVMSITLSSNGSSLQIKDNKYYLNGQEYTAGHLASSLSVSNPSGQPGGVLFFTLEVSEENLLSLQASVSLGDAYYQPAGTEDIGSWQDQLSALTISGPPEATAAPGLRLLVQGLAPGNSEITIRDNGQIVGQASSNQRGQWQAYITPDPTRRVHQLQASTALGDRILESNIFTTCLLSQQTPVIDDFTIWQPYKFEWKAGKDEGISSPVGVIYPYGDVYAKFKILHVDPDNVEYAAVVNRFRGQTTLYPASYDEQSGYWKATFKLLQPGELSALFSLKESEGVSYLTGSVPVDVSQLPDRAPVDPATLPAEIKKGQVVDLEDGSTNNDRIYSKINLGGNTYLEFTGTRIRVTADSVPSNFIRLETKQGAYYTAAPRVEHNIDQNGRGWIKVTKTVYFEKELFDALTGQSTAAAGGAARLPVFGPALAAAAGSEPSLAARQALFASTTQTVLEKADYVSYISGEIDFIVSTSQNPDALGKLGTGMTVFGGATLAGQALLGRMGKDPADLRAAANLIEEESARQRLYREIDEYAKATRDSHYINVFMGGVSNASSFFGPLGKGLSFVVSTGGQIYGTKIGNEYDIWYDAILRMIQVELEKQNRKKDNDKDKNKDKFGKEKDLFKPRWKIDPSGYVFEATPSNRVAGVEATALVQEGSSFRVWSEAADWGETNPQYTDNQGKYGWDVPEGTWKVRFSKPDYQTVETKPIPVPPVHDQVNIGLLATTPPRVQDARVYPDGVEIIFDRYMLPDSLEGNIALLDSEGHRLPIEKLQWLDLVPNTGYTADNPYSTVVIDVYHFGRTVRAVPESSLNLFDENDRPLQYQVSVARGATSYAGVSMAAEYEQTLTIQERPRLASLQLSGQFPSSFKVGDSFDLSSLTLLGKDQHAQEFSLSSQNITWQSSNPQVAAVNGATLSAHSAGKTSITASIGNVVSNALTCTVSPADTGGSTNNGGSTGGGSTGGGSTAPAAGSSSQQTVDKAAVQSRIQAGASTLLVQAPAGSTAHTTALETAAVQLIKQSGLTLQCQLGGHRLEIPASALPAPTADGKLQIKLQELSSTASGSLSGLKPAGPVLEITLQLVSGNETRTVSKLATPVKVRLAYQPAGFKEHALGAYHFRESEQQWQYVHSKVDRVNKQVVFSTDHFSKYTVMEYYKTFTDIANHWARLDIEEMASHRVVKGKDEQHYQPEAGITRAEFAALLVRALGLESPSGASATFQDVQPGHWYHGSVLAAYQAGLIQGYNARRFGATDPVSREQIVTMLVRALQQQGKGLSLDPQEQRQILSAYRDGEQVSSWARQAAALGLKTGLIKGRTTSSLAPAAGCTRAEGAVLLKRLLEMLD